MVMCNATHTKIASRNENMIRINILVHQNYNDFNWNKLFINTDWFSILNVNIIIRRKRFRHQQYNNDDALPNAKGPIIMWVI